jgi:hypothetical protein
VNENKEDNNIVGDYFLPIEKKTKIMFGGTGQSVMCKTFTCKPFLKDDPIRVTNERKNCECCLIV